MIDLGISKLAVIGVVALIVIGPEKLPKVARMAGTLFGRAQRYLNEVKSEVSRELELEELRKMQQDFGQQVQSATQEFEQSIAPIVDEANSWNSPESTSPTYPAENRYKVKNFKRKRLARTSAIPVWYKNSQGQRSHVISGAARMTRHRALRSISPSSFFK